MVIWSQHLEHSVCFHVCNCRDMFLTLDVLLTIHSCPITLTKSSKNLRNCLQHKTSLYTLLSAAILRELETTTEEQ
jgi:hypothetical protein